jgi:hypothetical protein
MMTFLSDLTTNNDMLNYAQFGVAGLMGALWWWERKYSRQREDELTEAHNALMGQQQHLSALLEALQGNTKVISDFTAVQNEILRVLRDGAAEKPPAMAEAVLPHA